jgi:hypothetical protein
MDGSQRWAVLASTAALDGRRRPSSEHGSTHTTPRADSKALPHAVVVLGGRHAAKAGNVCQRVLAFEHELSLDTI